MTMTSDRTAPTLEPPDLAPSVADQPDDDRRPGSSDLGWAERAYRHERTGPATEPRRVRRARRLRPRTLVAALVVVLLTAGLALAMAYQGSSSPAVVHRPARSHTVTAPAAARGGSHLTLTPQLLRPFPTLFPALGPQAR
jgi:hypothetical protein